MSITKNWLIALDFSDADKALIHYSSELLNYFSPGKIFFVHVVNNDSNPDFYFDIDDFNKQWINDLEKKLESFIEESFNSKILDYSTFVLEGDLVEAFINFTQKNQVDLVMVAKKSQSGMGLAVERLAKKLSACLMVVPENHSGSINKIMVPTDFSDHSNLSVRYAADFFERNTNLSLLAYHIVQIPPGAFSLDLKLQELTEKLMQKAQENMQKFIGPYRSFVDHQMDMQKELTIADIVLKKATQENIDLIMIGSKGHNHSPILMMGGATFKLLKINFSIPMLIVKLPDENKKWISFFKS